MDEIAYVEENTPHKYRFRFKLRLFGLQLLLYIVLMHFSVHWHLVFSRINGEGIAQ